MTIIDLGELTDTEFEPPPRPARSRRRSIRPIALAVVALLTVATATASARTPAPVGVRPLWNVAMQSTDAPYLAGDTVLLNRLNVDQDRATLTAYDAATGAVRWTADAGPVSSYPDLVTPTGVVLLPVAMADFRAGGTTTAFARTTAALDVATGARLWQLNAETIHAAGDTVLMNEHNAKDRVTRLRLVRLRDGGTIWSRALAVTDAVAASDNAVVTVDDHGTATMLRWSDGAVLRTRTVPWTPQRVAGGGHSELAITAGTLQITHFDDSSTASIVYRLDSLAEVWRGASYLSDCGPVVCSPEEDGVVGRDPLTGAERWRLRQAPNAYPIGSDRLLAESVTDGGQKLIDARTGRIIATLGDGQMPSAPGPAPGPLLLLLPVVKPPLHITVLQVDRATGAEVTLGALPWMGDGNASCQAGPRYLICPGHERLYVTGVG